MTRYCLTGVEKPPKRGKRIPVALTDATMDERLNRVIGKMDQENLDVLVIYGDLEHGSNFEYLTGFLPRFEEGILVLHRDRTAFLMLGNENTKMVRYSRIPAGLIHVPFLSLPNQPMEDDRPIHEDVYKRQGQGLKQYSALSKSPRHPSLRLIFRQSHTNLLNVHTVYAS